MAKNIVEWLIKANDQSGPGISSAVGRLGAVNSVLGSIKGQLAGILSVGALVALGKQAIDLGGNLDDMGKKFGVSAGWLSQMSYPAKMVGVEVEGVGNAMKFLSKSIAEAKNPASESAKAFRALGLSEMELQGKATSEVFEMLADSFAGLKDGANKTVLALALFGKSGADLLPMFEKGAAGMRSMAEESVRLGLSLTDEQIKALDDMGDAIDRVGLRAKVAAGSLAVWIDKALKGWDAYDKFNQARYEAAQKDPGLARAMLANLSIAESHQDEDVRDERGGYEYPYANKRNAPSIAGKKTAGGTAKNPIAEAQKEGLAELLALESSALDAAYKGYSDGLAKAAELRDEYDAEEKKDLEDQAAAFGAYYQKIIDADYEAAEASANYWKDFFDSSTTMLDDLSWGFSDAFNTMGDFITNFCVTGEMRFGDMARSMIADITRVLIQWSIVQPLAAGFAGLVGIPIPGRAAGGPVSAGSAYLVGERGPELFVPGSSGSIVPNGGGDVTVNIINKSGAQVSGNATTRVDGQRMIVDVVLDAMSRNVGGLRTAVSAARG